MKAGDQGQIFRSREKKAQCESVRPWGGGGWAEVS